MRTALLVLVALAGCAACEGREGEPRGLGPYRFGIYTLARVSAANCQPTELTDGRKATWCFALPPIKIGKHAAEVDAYFLGADTSTDQMTHKEREAIRAQLPLIELQLKIRGCVEDELETWMRQRFGPPIESKSTRVYWKNSFLWAAAMLPSEPGRCVVHFLPISENAEIERIKAK